MAFNLADMLRDTAETAAAEVLQAIDLDLIDEDERNFYSLSGLDDLAANIELLGLMDPIRVREADGGRYIVVSGHRRRAACIKLRDEGNDKFKTVPCIVEQGGSEAMQELRLIYANRSTRVLSSADLQRQTERVTELLYQLKSEGVEFPGRMAEHVAQACNISTSKLKRLNAIKNNLTAEFYSCYQAGTLNETAAYALSRMPVEVQQQLAGKVKIMNMAQKENGITSMKVDEAIKRMTIFMSKDPCKHDVMCSRDPINCIATSIACGAWWSCGGGCCEKCGHLSECPYPCAHAKAQLAAEKAEVKAKEAAKKAAAAEAKATEEALRRIRYMEQVTRLTALADRAGLEDDEMVGSRIWNKIPVGSLRKLASEGFPANASYWNDDYSLLDCKLADLERLADQLRCTVGALAGEPVTASIMDTATWRVGRPSRAGNYYCKFDCGGTEIRSSAYYSESYDEFSFKRGGPRIDATLLGWVPLPED